MRAVFGGFRQITPVLRRSEWHGSSSRETRQTREKWRALQRHFESRSADALVRGASATTEASEIFWRAQAHRTCCGRGRPRSNRSVTSVAVVRGGNEIEMKSFDSKQGPHGLALACRRNLHWFRIKEAQGFPVSGARPPSIRAGQFLLTRAFISATTTVNFGSFTRLLNSRGSASWS